MCSLRGTPFLYYGQELGLPDAEIPADRVVDVDGRDPERAPMPWLPRARPARRRLHRGEPWLPVVAEAGGLCVESQRHEPVDARVRPPADPSALARTHAAVRGQRLVGAAPDVFCFERQLDQRFLVALNFTSNKVPLGLRDGVGGPAMLELSTDPGRGRGPLDLRDLVLQPDEGLILRFRAG